jgi:hypothetical protein
MASVGPFSAPSDDTKNFEKNVIAMPSMGVTPWMVSLAVHCLLMLSLGLAMPPRRPSGTTETPPQAGIVLAARRASGAGALAGRDGAAETELFGLRGRGTRFVYVFDRSASMEGPPLAAAKRELIASLQQLQATHQFQIIFYNQQPRIMSLRGGPPQMVFADEAGKRLAASFVGSVFADGGTDHMQALAMALRLGPDVLFFLTDADEPQLHTEDFQRIRALNRGTIIHAVEFGVGPLRRGDSFLARLAKENGGQHTYVDVTRLGR